MKSASLYSATVFDHLRSAIPPRARKLLDFGAGDGFFMQKLLDGGIAVDGVEPDLQLRARLQSSGVLIYSDIREVTNASCDFIYSINVLEHLVNLDDDCAELFRVIKPQGKLFVFVPAFELLWTTLDDEVGHFRRFSWTSLRRTLEHAGFFVDRLEYFDCIGFPAALGVRLLEKLNLFRYEESTVGLYDRVLFPISCRLDPLFKRILGKNIIAIAHKKM